jgi:hypothetical protein
MRRARFFATSALALSLGCTSITVQPIEASVGLQRVCIERNPDVQVIDFLDVLRAGFLRHGIETELFSGTVPSSCEFVLEYTALRSWDLGSYLSHAELQLERSGQPIASAVFHLRGKGGYALTKYQGTKTKMDPVIDELLAQYPARASSP